MPSAARRPPHRLHPEPGRFWVAWSPRTWRCAEGVWTDLANGRLAGFQGRPEPSLPELELSRLDDLFYLPPVTASLARDRDRLAAAATAAGAPVLVQLAPGEPSEVADAHLVWDLAAPLIAGDLEALRRVPAGGVAVWPLIPGLTGSAETWERGCELLRAAGARCVQPLTVEIDPVVRRCLAEENGDEQVFRALFHGVPPSERDFARCAARHGFDPFMERPALGGRRRAGNRRIAAALALAGELWLRLGRPESGGQTLLHAARCADATGYDLAALAREGNLAVMDWLDGAGTGIVAEVAARGKSSFVTELRDRYLDPTAR